MSATAGCAVGAESDPGVRLSLSDEASSALLEQAEPPTDQEPEMLYVVMPMRL